jgi:hypothetical protein
MGINSNELRAQIGSTPSVGEEPTTDPFAHETGARENILAGGYQTLDSIVLSGDEVLELKNQTLVVNGDILLSDNARLVVEKFVLSVEQSILLPICGAIERRLYFRG